MRARNTHADLDRNMSVRMKGGNDLTKLCCALFTDHLYQRRELHHNTFKVFSNNKTLPRKYIAKAGDGVKRE